MAIERTNLGCSSHENINCTLIKHGLYDVNMKVSHREQGDISEEYSKKYVELYELIKKYFEL